MAEEGAQPCDERRIGRRIMRGEQNRGGALERVASKRRGGEALLPVRSTLVAPILPEPMARMSGPPAARVRISPNGIEPSR